jgi:hypothetical protein
LYTLRILHSVKLVRRRVKRALALGGLFNPSCQCDLLP